MQSLLDGFKYLHAIVMWKKNIYIYIPEGKQLIFASWTQGKPCHWVAFILKLISPFLVLETSGEQYYPQRFNWLLDGQIS